MNSNNENAFFSRTFHPTKRLFTRLMLRRELWWVRLANGNRHFSVFGLECEEDAKDPTLKVFSIVILGFALSIGYI